MSAELILQPVMAMMLLTAVVWFVMYAKRIPAMQQARIPTQTWTTPEKVVELLPEAVNYPAYNLKNLFELPVVFYALCVILYVTDSVDTIYVAAAWTFFGFRVLHSLIHCTVNRVMARFLCYLVGSLALWFMVGRAATDLLF